MCVCVCMFFFLWNILNGWRAKGMCMKERKTVAKLIVRHLVLLSKWTDFNWYEPQFDINMLPIHWFYVYFHFRFLSKSLYRTMNWIVACVLSPGHHSGFILSRFEWHIHTFWFNFLNFHRMIFKLYTRLVVRNWAQAAVRMAWDTILNQNHSVATVAVADQAK